MVFKIIRGGMFEEKRRGGGWGEGGNKRNRIKLLSLDLLVAPNSFCICSMRHHCQIEEGTASLPCPWSKLCYRILLRWRSWEMWE